MISRCGGPSCGLQGAVGKRTGDVRGMGTVQANPHPLSTVELAPLQYRGSSPAQSAFHNGAATRHPHSGTHHGTGIDWLETPGSKVSHVQQARL